MADRERRGLDAVEEGPRPSDAPSRASENAPATPSDHPSRAALETRFGAAVLRHRVAAGDQTVVWIDPAVSLEILRWLKDDPSQLYDMMSDVTAVDYGGGRPVEVVYQMFSTRHKRALRVRCALPLDALEIDSVAGLWQSANWLEREVYDLFGVTFRGHPDLRRILMPFDYAEGHPLRKDFPLRGRFSRAEQTRRALAQDVERFYGTHDLEVGGSPQEVLASGEKRGGLMAQRTVELAVGRNPEMGVDGRPAASPLAPFDIAEPQFDSERMLINIGPQHPATHGVLRLVCELDGETVLKVVPDIGYLHSSFEKLGEYRTWNQIVTLTDRMDYLAPLIYNCAYVMSVEKLMGIEVTERCKVVRVICMELDRIFGHLLWLGTTAIDVGAFTPFLYAFQQRERIYTLHEALTGARITTSATRVGGMMADLPEGWIRALEDFLDTFPDTLYEVDRLLTTNQIHIGRTQGIGAITAEEAINYGLTGPNLRAAGVDYDVRKDRPYYDYETYDFEVPVGEHGDCYDRYLCRMEEMRQSVLLLRQAIARLPGGPINVQDPAVSLPSKTDCMSDMESMIHHFKLITDGIPAPEGDCYFAVEGSKGELGMYVVAEEGGTKPVRWRVRPPSFVNLSAIARLSEGHLVSDLIMINASLDIVLGEIDR